MKYGILFLIDNSDTGTKVLNKLQQLATKVEGRNPLEIEPGTNQIYEYYVLAGTEDRVELLVLLNAGVSQAIKDGYYENRLPGSVHSIEFSPDSLSRAEMERRGRIRAGELSFERIWIVDTNTNTSGNLINKFT